MLWRIGRALVNPDECGSVYGRFGSEDKIRMMEILTRLVLNTTSWVS